VISPKTTSILSRLPSFYRSEEDDNVLYRLLEAYAFILERADDDLVRVMRSHWVDKAGNEGSEGFDAQQKGDLDKLFALWLESLGGTSLLRQTGRRLSGQGGEEDDEAYRERIKALIDVIRRGASTVDGIKAVVAANLGIIGKDPIAEYARKQIRMEEYLPTATRLEVPTLALYTPFIVKNINPVHTPVGFYIKVKGALSIPIVGLYVELPSARQTIGCPVNLDTGDELYLFFDKKALLNGQPVTAFGTGIQLPPGDARLQVGAKLGYPAGVFGQSRFDSVNFDVDEAEEMGRFDASAFDKAAFALPDAVLDVTVLLYNISPGAFTVSIPWDSPGFTSAFSLPASAQAVLEKIGIVPAAGFESKVYEKISDLIAEPWMREKPDLLEEGLRQLAPLLLPGEDLFQRMEINPRAQIRAIVDRVRAAGIYAVVNYEKRFLETNGLADNLALSAKHRPLAENMGIDPVNHDKLKILTLQKPDPETHDLNDNLLISGLFDRTNFDTLNSFA